MTARLALVGLGRWAEAHAAAAARSDKVTISTCFTRSAERRADFAQRWSIPATASSYDEVLADPTVDGLVLSTPNDVHVDMTIAAIGAGKAVLVDKPVAIGVAQGLKLVRAMDANGPRVLVAHHPRRLAGHRAIERWHRSGDAGAIRAVHGTFSNNRGLSISPNAWHRHIAGSEAGVLIQVGIHQIDNVCSLLGPADTVNARFVYGELGAKMPITAMVTTTHTGHDSVPAVASVSSSWTTPGHYRFEVEATNATMTYRLDHGHWTQADVDRHGELTIRTADGERRNHPTTPGDPLRDQLDDLADASAGLDASRLDGDLRPPGVVEGLQAIAVVEAAVESAASGGGPISIPDLFSRAGATADEIALFCS